MLSCAGERFRATRICSSSKAKASEASASLAGRLLAGTPGGFFRAPLRLRTMIASERPGSDCPVVDVCGLEVRNIAEEKRIADGPRLWAIVTTFHDQMKVQESLQSPGGHANRTFLFASRSTCPEGHTLRCAESTVLRVSDSSCSAGF